ncbi:hypothetical protein H0H93_014694 [Arthromyces matolae]|nr:hypothetical protein H0H93_014694 [Arthromyces matolae]
MVEGYYYIVDEARLNTGVQIIPIDVSANNGFCGAAMCDNKACNSPIYSSDPTTFPPPSTTPPQPPLYRCPGAGVGFQVTGVFPPPRNSPPVTIHPNGDTSKCLDIRGGVIANGTAIQIYDCNGSKAQQWLVSAGYTLISHFDNPGFNVDAGSANPKNGDKVKLWLFSESLLPEQGWDYTEDKRIQLLSIVPNPNHRIRYRERVLAVVLEDSMLALVNQIYLTDTTSHFQWIYWKDVIDIDSDVFAKRVPAQWIALNPHCRIRKEPGDNQHPVTVTIGPETKSHKLSKASVEKIQELMTKINDPTARSSYFNERIIFGHTIEPGMLFSVKREFINPRCRRVIPEAEGGSLLVLVNRIDHHWNSGDIIPLIWPFISSRPPAGEDITTIQWKTDSFSPWGLKAFLSQTGLNPKDYILMHTLRDCHLVPQPPVGDHRFYGTWQPQTPRHVRVTYPWYGPPSPRNHQYSPVFEEEINIAASPLKVHPITLKYMQEWQEAVHRYHRQGIANQGVTVFPPPADHHWGMGPA